MVDRHDPPVDAAGFVAGELSTVERADFEAHLPTCDECRAEVVAGRRGRDMAEGSREHAPSGLQTRVADLIATGEAPRRPQRSRRAVLAAAAVIVVGAAGGAALFQRLLRSAPDPVSTALAEFGQALFLPGSTPVKAESPSLLGLGLTQTAAGAGDLDGHPVTGFGYRDRGGRRVTVYVSDQAFPMPDDADQSAGPGGPWTVRRRDVIAVCAAEPHELLVVGDDWGLVAAVVDLLDVS